MVMLMAGLYRVVVVGVLSWVGVSGVVWREIVVFVVVMTCMGVGEATGVVWEI
jgi:hypothetical protein